MAAASVARLLMSGSKSLAKRKADRSEKFMGMVDEVEAKRLSGPSAAKVADKPYSKGKLAAAAGAAGVAGAAGYAASRDEEEKKVPQRVSVAPSDDSAPVSRKENAASEEKKEPTKKQSGTSAFGKEFRAARNAGLSTFEFDGKKYNTMLAGETKEEHKEKLAKIKEKNEAAYEKKIQELAMAKGGSVPTIYAGVKGPKKPMLARASSMKAKAIAPKKLAYGSGGYTASVKGKKK
jgi:hypothetical protein